jgi:hypothetical protein
MKPETFSFNSKDTLNLSNPPGNVRSNERIVWKLPPDLGKLSEAAEAKIQPIIDSYKKKIEGELK